MKRPTIILVLGIPASGKTTLAKQLGRELALPCISKDELKLILFDEYEARNRADSEKAGRAAYALLDHIIEEQLRAGCSMVVESTFSPAFSSAKFQKLQEKYAVRYVQVWCYADDDVIRQRFRGRAAETDEGGGGSPGDTSRHVSQIEGKGGLQNLEKLLERGFAPLDVKGEVIKLDTTDFAKVDQASIAARVQEYLNQEALND